MKGFIAVLSMVIIIFDSKTALQGASEGVQLCLQTIIPSLFPFFVLSNILNHYLIGRKIPLLHPLCKHCGIPDGCESVFLLGLIAGYPIGAKLISDAYKEQVIPKTTAHRMLGFCNNAGPAFIFGITTPLFSKFYYVWLIWGLQILSAILVGFILPKTYTNYSNIKQSKSVSIVEAVQSSIKNIALVCGWVIIFRVIISFSDKWFLWRFPMLLKAFYCGILELSNGIIQLKNLSIEAYRFIAASFLLAIGGLCVGLQTRSVSTLLGSGYYFPGKVLQSLICLFFSIVLQNFLFSGADRISLSYYWYIFLFVCIIAVSYFLRKKVAISKQMVYNIKKH